MKHSDMLPRGVTRGRNRLHLSGFELRRKKQQMKESKFSIVANVVGTILYLYGLVLGFKAGFVTGVAYACLVITPVVTAIAHIFSGFKFNLAVLLTDFVNANPGVVGIAAIAAIVVVSYALLAAWFKVITMFSRM